MRLLFLILLLANVAAFGYIRYSGSRSSADAQIAMLQIGPEKLKLLNPGTAPSDSRGRSALPPLVCLEWGSFAAEDAARAAVALSGLGLSDKLSQREGSESYWVYIPPVKTKAEADKKAAEVKALGFSDISVVLDNSQWQFAVALGEFSSAEAADIFLAQVRQKGVRSAVIGPRGAKNSTFVIRDPADAIAAKLAELKTDFPAAQLKATVCAEAVASKK